MKKIVLIFSIYGVIFFGMLFSTISSVYAYDANTEGISDIPLTMELKGTELRDALDAISYMSGTPIIVNEKLKGTVTARFANMKFVEILNLLSENFKFDWTVSNGVVLVGPSEEFTTKSKTFNVKHLDLKILKSKLETFIDGKNIAIDEGQNAITINGTSAELARAENLIKCDDLPVAQVNIQAHIVEMNRSDAELLGFKHSWNKYDSSLKDWKFVYSTTLQAEEILRMGKILARPSITTFNGSKATFHVGDKVPILTQKISDSGSTETTVTFEDVGISLDVTPRVNDEEKRLITTRVHPTVSSIAKYITNSDTMAPQISKRDAETIVRVKSGETLIIGGLIKDEERETMTEIPYLSKIPLVGNIFKHKDKSVEKTELFIFLTPTLIDDSIDDTDLYNKTKDKYLAI